MRKYSVPMIAIFSGLSFLVLLFGLGWTIQNYFFGKPAENALRTEKPAEEKSKKGKMIVALGDSLTRGTGDPDGKGYIGYLVDELQDKSDEKIILRNLGIKGYLSSQLLEQVKQQEVQRQIRQADIILITIGGNDLFQGGQTLTDLNLDRVEKLRGQYLKNLRETITVLRSLNSDGTIFLIGLYNPFIDLNNAEATTEVVRQWNFATSGLLDKYSQTVFVPTFDLFQLKVNDYLYSDKFHPNAEGYKLIAERVASLITW